MLILLNVSSNLKILFFNAKIADSYDNEHRIIKIEILCRIFFRIKRNVDERKN